MNELIGGDAQCITYNTPYLQPAGPVDQLKNQKQLLETQLSKVNAALDALNKNPEIADILQLVGKALR